MTSEETFEETDGILNDTILVVCNIIAGLLKNNIDSLKLPAILKTAFKKLKNLSVGVKSGESEWREPEVEENAENSVQAKETDGPSREGREEQRQGSSEE